MVNAVIAQVESNNVEKEDTFAKLLGHFGRWQFIVFSSVFLVKLSSGWVQMAILFLTPNLTFWCVEFSSNHTLEVVNSTCYVDCLRYEYDTRPFGNTIVSEWDLICDRRWLTSLTQMVLQLGILTGSVIFGFLSDRYGRKNTFLVSITFLIAFGFAIPFSSNYIIFTVLRFFLGMATAGTIIISFVIIMETVGPKYRDIIGCFFQIPFILGHLTTPLFAYYYRNWNSYSLALAVPPLMYLGYFFLLTESPRWLVSVGRVGEATEIVKRAAEMNDRPTTNIEEILIKLSKEIKSNTDESKLNYLDLFRSSLRLKMICCCAMWLILGLTYFGFNQYIGQTSSNPFLSVAISAAIQIPSNFIAMFLIRYYGRKSTTATFFFLAGIFVLTLGFLPKIFWLNLTLAALGISCASIAATSIYIYTSELFPTVVRNMSMGASSTSMRVGSMVAPFVANLSMTMSWMPTVIFGFAPIAAGAICLLLPDTKGGTLPDGMDDLKTED